MSARIAARPRLLFVDDEQRVLNSMRAMFRRDYEIFLTTRGEEALKIVSEQPIDVLVADQRMPMMSGVEVLSAARQCAPDTVRILLTGCADTDAMEAAVNDGKVFRLLHKPCPADELRGIIADAIEIARRGQNAPVESLKTMQAPRINGAVSNNANGKVNSTPTATSQPQSMATDHDEIAGPAGVYDVDKFDNTTTMEIVMSGDQITVLQNGDSAPQPQPHIRPAPEPEPRAPTPQSEVPTDEFPILGPPYVPEPAVAPTPAARPDPAPAASAVDPEPVPAPLKPTTAPPGARDWPTLLLYIVGALLAIVTGAWLLLSLRGTELPAAVATPAEPSNQSAPPATRQVAGYSLEENLDFAALALDAGALIDPADGSALAFYIAARNQAPHDNAVVRGLDKLAQLIDKRAATQLAQRDLAGLAASLSALAKIDATDPRLTDLRDGFDLAVQRSFDRADNAIATREWGTATALIDELATLPGADPMRIATAREAIEGARQRAAMRTSLAAARAGTASANTITEPVPDLLQPIPGAAIQPATVVAPTATAASAPDLAMAQEPVAADESPIDELLASTAASLAADRLTAPDGDSALYYLQQIRSVEPDNPRLAAGMADLADALLQRARDAAQSGDWDAAAMALTQTDSLGVAAARVTQAREQILAGAITSEMSRVIPVREMQTRTFTAPQYPESALRQSREGWVLLHFTVQHDGSVTDIDAVETSDRTRTGRQFVRAAVAAAQTWSFEPRAVLGQTIPQRVQARVNFQLAD